MVETAAVSRETGQPFVPANKSNPLKATSFFSNNYGTGSLAFSTSPVHLLLVAPSPLLKGQC